MKNIILTTLLLALVACGENNKESYTENSNLAMLQEQREHPGKALLEQNCYACHDATTAHEERIAPPMFAIKKHYLRNEVTKEDFTQMILDWTSGPSEEKAKMPGAIEKFGVMPYQKFDPAEIELIAAYLYETELEKPECCENKMKAKGENMGGGHGKGKGKGMGKGQHQCKGKGNCCGKGSKS